MTNGRHAAAGIWEIRFLIHVHNTTYICVGEQTLDLAAVESLKGIGRLYSSESQPPLHESGVVGLALWLWAALLLTDTYFDLRWRPLHSSGNIGFGSGARFKRTRSSTTIASSVMAALTHSSSMAMARERDEFFVWKREIKPEWWWQRKLVSYEIFIVTIIYKSECRMTWVLITISIFTYIYWLYVYVCFYGGDAY